MKKTNYIEVEMWFTFQKLTRHQSFPSKAFNLICLKENSWDDYGFKTIFTVMVFDDTGVGVELGNTKIAYLKQTEGWTSAKMLDRFDSLGTNFFSLGQDSDYYLRVVEGLRPDVSEQYLISIRDMVRDNGILTMVEKDAEDLRANNFDSVYYSSLLRNVSVSNIKNQFVRILSGGKPLTEYSFSFFRPQSNKHAEVSLNFEVDPDLKPSTNIHILIGRNGVGKTTILNGMVDAIMSKEKDVEDLGRFYISRYMSKHVEIEDDYFSGVISVSFSAFDPFIPPPTQSDPSKGTCYHYIGLKKYNNKVSSDNAELKSISELRAELVESLKGCLSLSGKKERWIAAVKKLESDDNFAEINFKALVDISEKDETENKNLLGLEALRLLNMLSSGHAIVLLTLTKLVEYVEEKTLVLIDEPESHLHPPLLAAFTRALSELLLNRNGVAILATHSPVVLQEVPKSCVSILRRTRLSGKVEKPNAETFGENVGVLTREVFGLEVSKSGYYDLLAKDALQGKRYEEILSEYNEQLGFEGRAILRALIATKEDGL
ncbi:AAA family ATPase [Enterobacter hormaechei]